MAPGPSFPPIVSWKLGCKNTVAQSSRRRNAMARTSLFNRGRAATDTPSHADGVQGRVNEERPGALYGEAPGSGPAQDRA